MQINDLKTTLLNRDRCIKVISKDGLFRAVLVKNSNSAITAQLNHKLSQPPAFVLARILTGASMLASLLKGEERVVLEIEGSGIVSRALAEALQVGEVRGYARLSEITEPIMVNNISDFVGLGLLKVTKIMYNHKQPVQGIVHLQYGDLANDLAYYFTQSEQVPTFIQMDTQFADDGLLEQSGGIMFQSLPDAKQSDIEQLYEKIVALPPVCDLFSQNISPVDCLKELIPFGYNVIASTPLDFFCRCSKDVFKSKILTLNKSEIEGMYEDNHNELICQYCNKHYYLTKEDFDQLLAEKTAKLN